MSLLTDTDIRHLLNREIIIDPFTEDNLTPVGYDLSVGDFVYSLHRGLLEVDPKTKKYEIAPGDVVLILSKEFVWVSGRIAGTFHSKVSMVSRGFSHIGTTLDPEWKGNLLISIANLSKECLELEPGQKYVTLVFYNTRHRATKPHTRPPARSDILMQLLGRTNPTVSQEEADHHRIKSLGFSEEVA